MLRVHTFRIHSLARCFFFLHLLFSHFDCRVNATPLALYGWLAGWLNLPNATSYMMTMHTASTCWDDCIRDNICASVYKINENQIKIKLNGRWRGRDKSRRKVNNKQYQQYQQHQYTHDTHSHIPLHIQCTYQNKDDFPSSFERSSRV